MERLFQNECGSSEQWQWLWSFCATVLQVSGARTTVQLRPAGYAATQAANVQRTVSLQAYPVTLHLYPTFSTLLPPSPNPNKTEGQWNIKKQTREANNWLQKERLQKKKTLSLPTSREMTSTVCDVIVSLCFVCLRFPLFTLWKLWFNFQVMVIPLWLTEAKTSFLFGNVLIIHPIIVHLFFSLNRSMKNIMKTWRWFRTGKGLGHG